MKINTHIVLVGLSIGFFYLLFESWSNSIFKNHDYYSPKAIGHINKLFKNDLNALVNSTKDFHVAVQDYLSKSKSENKLKDDYRNLRDKFKSVEFLIEYLDKEAYDKKINGAPLPKLEQKVADISVLEPHGLQVIDELIGSDLGSSDEKKDLLHEIEIFETNVLQLESYFRHRTISDRQFFEASRQAIIRIGTLGITGFDTPGSLQGLEDTVIILRSLNDYVQLYRPELATINNIQLLKATTVLFKEGIKTAKKSGFDDFDRLSFIKNIINPLYKNLKTIHLELNYETIDEVSRFVQAVNYNADNVFDSDFLNPFYYVSLEKDSTFEAKAELGKLLFYDPILSKDNTMACATCHNPKKGFTDGETLSISNKGGHLERNAMTLNYAVYATRFFHDLRAKRLEDQFEHVVLSEDEFDSSYKEILEKIKNSNIYTSMFQNAFTDKNKINYNDIDYALVAYVMQLNSFDSEIDKYFQDENAQLPEAVKRGFNLFTGKAACATCHFVPLFSGNLPPLFIDSEAEVLGVPDKKEEPWTLDDDLGRVGNGVTSDVANFYKGAFKTPTVRNIALTGPYMHNGVFDTLEEVMDFYNKGGGAGNGIELEHQTLANDPLNLTQKEIDDIITFMEALNDTNLFERPKTIPRDFTDTKINQRSF